MAATTARSPKSARPQGQPPRGPEKSPFQHLAEVAARAQALLNNPKAEKSSFRHEPVRLVPAPDELPSALQLDVRAASASSLPPAGLGSHGTGSQPVQDNRSRSAVSPARATARESANESADVPSSLLPQAGLGSRGTGSQPVQDNPARRPVSLARATGRGTRACPEERRATRPSTVAQAKNYLRATRSPQFLRSTADLSRHRRKCAICRHPEREMIEEMFIHWHSPQAIAHFLRDYDEINWVSIYRHAYALGLDLIRRRHLNYIFENILDESADAIPTIAGIVAAARALSCLTEDGRWVEPEKRITMTTIVRHEDPQALTSTNLVEDNQPVPVGADYARPEGFPAVRQEPNVASFASTPPPAALDAPALSASAPVRARLFTPREAKGQPCRKQPGNKTALAAEANSLDAANSHRPERRLRAHDVSGAGSQPVNGNSALAPSSSLPQAAFGNRGTGSQPVQDNPSRNAARSASREISLTSNSHKTKDKPIPNR